MYPEFSGRIFACQEPRPAYLIGNIFHHFTDFYVISKRICGKTRKFPILVQNLKINLRHRVCYQVKFNGKFSEKLGIALKNWL